MTPVTLLPALALAHAVGLSQGTYTRTHDGLEASLTFTRAEVMTAAGQSEVAPWLAQLIEVNGCTVSEQRVRPAEDDGLTFYARWTCASDASAQVTLRLLGRLSPGHRHFAGEAVLSAADATFDPGRPPARGFLSLVALGVEHILSGWDHLLFLLGMVLMVTRRRDVLAVVTAFTVAHSLTLGASVLGFVSPSPRLVEPIIALSIAWVGMENLFKKQFSTRWRVAFGFGLLHGFGFAGALGDVGASVAELPRVLAGFNLGVELGQLAVLALILPVLAWARRFEFACPRLSPALSMLVVVPGVVCFVARIVDP
jgi:hydrogenase/urease accessory protein HupE